MSRLSGAISAFNAPGARANGLWNVAQQASSTLSNSLITILMVTALPVSSFGIYSYATSVTSIGLTVMTAGISGLGVKAYVNRSEETALITNALVLIREVFAALGFLLVLLATSLSGNSEMTWAVVIASISLFGRALAAPELWYMARLDSQKPATVRIVTTGALLLLRLALLYVLPNIWLFLFLYSAEQVICGIVIMIQYARDHNESRFGFPDRETTTGFLKDSVPLMLSGVANQINLKGDVVIVGAMLGATSVGVYSAATRISELAYFLPVVFMNSTLPVLLKARKDHGPQGQFYKQMLQRSYDSACWAGIAVAIGMLVVGRILIFRVFGQDYGESWPILAIHILACPFVFMAAVYSKWIISEGVLWMSLVRHMTGAVANVALNIMLIPHFGLQSAAWATVVSYAMASYGSTFLSPTSREAGVSMTLAFVAPVRYAYVAFRRGRRQAATS